MQPGYFSASVQTRSLDRSLGPPTRGNRSEIRRNRFPLFLSETARVQCERTMNFIVARERDDPDFQPGLCFPGQSDLRGIERVRN